jgi:hypothetical protein
MEFIVGGGGKQNSVCLFFTFFEVHVQAEKKNATLMQPQRQLSAAKQTGSKHKGAETQKYLCRPSPGAENVRGFYFVTACVCVRVLVGKSNAFLVVFSASRRTETQKTSKTGQPASGSQQSDVKHKGHRQEDEQSNSSKTRTKK